VFSLHPAMKPKITDGKAKPRPVMFCGLAAKDIAAWQPDSLTFNEQVGLQSRYCIINIVGLVAPIADCPAYATVAVVAVVVLLAGHSPRALLEVSFLSPRVCCLCFLYCDYCCHHCLRCA
jgi:hypothetical protein